MRVDNPVVAQAIIDLHRIASELSHEFKSDNGAIVRAIVELADRLYLLERDY